MLLDGKWFNRWQCGSFSWGGKSMDDLGRLSPRIKSMAGLGREIWLFGLRKRLKARGAALVATLNQTETSHSHCVMSNL
jgi:hypothetical protein